MNLDWKVCFDALTVVAVVPSLTTNNQPILVLISLTGAGGGCGAVSDRRRSRTNADAASSHHDMRLFLVFVLPSHFDTTKIGRHPKYDIRNGSMNLHCLIFSFCLLLL